MGGIESANGGNSSLGGGTLALMMWQLLSLVQILNLNSLVKETIGPIMFGLLGNFYQDGSPGGCPHYSVGQRLHPVLYDYVPVVAARAHLQYLRWADSRDLGPSPLSLLEGWNEAERRIGRGEPRTERVCDLLRGGSDGCDGVGGAFEEAPDDASSVSPASHIGGGPAAIGRCGEHCNCTARDVVEYASCERRVWVKLKSAAEDCPLRVKMQSRSIWLAFGLANSSTRGQDII